MNVFIVPDKAVRCQEVVLGPGREGRVRLGRDPECDRGSSHGCLCKQGKTMIFALLRSDLRICKLLSKNPYSNTAKGITIANINIFF